MSHRVADRLAEMGYPRPSVNEDGLVLVDTNDAPLLNHLLAACIDEGADFVTPVLSYVRQHFIGVVDARRMIDWAVEYAERVGYFDEPQP